MDKDLIVLGYVPGKRERPAPGEPCRHPGCLSHISHPCEGCGRIAGIPCLMRLLPEGTGNQPGRKWVSFFCPGCNCSHAVPVEGPKAWEWNDSLTSPTLKPSLAIDLGVGGKCHLYVGGHDGSKPGKIVYLSDCTHKLAGKTIDMEDIEING